MRSVRDEDLTARARIRDAGVLLFGRDGYDRTSVRAIAQEAGVSPALVIHHFGSKDGLRVECSSYVVDEFLGRKGELTQGDAVSAIERWLDDVEQFRPMIDYLARILSEETVAADELFDALLAGTSSMIDEQVTAGIMREPLDRQVLAAYVTAYGVVPLLMKRQMARAFGTDALDANLVRRSTLPILDLYTHGLYVDDRYLTAAREALGRTSGPRSDKGENDPNQDPDPPAQAG